MFYHSHLCCTANYDSLARMTVIRGREAEDSHGASHYVMAYDRSRPLCCYHKRTLSAIDPDVAAEASPLCAQINSCLQGTASLKTSLQLTILKINKKSVKYGKHTHKFQ